jgi:hypothetical protein
MIDLYNSETNQPIGSISDADLQVLMDALEEESSDDRDYYINADTIDLLAEHGSPELIEMLRSALASAEGLEIRWERR